MGIEQEKSKRHRPLQLFYKAIQGGLGEGNIGLLVSRHGTGKRGVFVSLVLDHAMVGKNSLTVAVGKSVDSIRAYQDEVLRTMMESLDLSDRASLMTKVERHRQIYSFGESSFSMQKLRETMSFLQETANFSPDVVDLYGWPELRKIGAGDMEDIKALARDYQCKIWLADHSSREDELNDQGLPKYLEPSLANLSVIIGLEPEANHVNLKFHKTHNQPPPDHLHLIYDPRTQLLGWR